MGGCLTRGVGGVGVGGVCGTEGKIGIQGQQIHLPDQLLTEREPS